LQQMQSSIFVFMVMGAIFIGWGQARWQGWAQPSKYYAYIYTYTPIYINKYIHIYIYCRFVSTSLYPFLLKSCGVYQLVKMRHQMKISQAHGLYQLVKTRHQMKISQTQLHWWWPLLVSGVLAARLASMARMRSGPSCAAKDSAAPQRRRSR
jgi:hypothetical protein